MASYNTNYELISLPVGSYALDYLGNGFTASTVHQIYCASAGTITITGMGGGTTTLPMTSGQSLSIIPRAVTVSSGGFIGFRAKLEGNSIQVFGL
jgi:hypothetical protein